MVFVYVVLIYLYPHSEVDDRDIASSSSQKINGDVEPREDKGPCRVIKHKGSALNTEPSLYESKFLISQASAP